MYVHTDVNCYVLLLYSQELKQADYPHVSKDGVTAHVVAGSALGATSPVYTKQPTAYAHFEMQPNSKLQQPIDKDWNAFVYTISGKAKFNGKAAEGHHTLLLERPTESDGLLVETADSPAEFLIISGKPTNEPTLQYVTHFFMCNDCCDVAYRLTSLRSPCYLQVWPVRHERAERALSSIPRLPDRSKWV